MFQPQIVHVLAPQTAVGWVLRLGVLFLMALGLIMLPDAFDHGLPQAALWSHIPEAVLLGVPLGAMLLWTMKNLDRAQCQVQRISQVDDVTGMPNRRAFLARTARALPQSGVMLMLDLDHFKAVNARRGHHVGDLCLMALAQRCRELTRATDIIGRLDGTVFAIYLPGAPVETGREIAGRLAEGIQVATKQGVLNMTISVGAVVADGWTPLDTLMRDADHALERAKLQGRARVVLQDLPEAA